MTTINILVTGGAGYIGSHTSRQLIEAGYSVTVVDNLYSGHRWAIPDEATFIEGDVGDHPLMESVLKERKINAVVHFAGHIVVPESVSDPLKYYSNNALNSGRLIAACQEAGVEHFVFSSTAATYGAPQVTPIDEQVRTEPINPYGRTKLITEWMLEDIAHAANRSPFRYIALRYFNVAGASLDTTLGQATAEATHLIKVACEAATGQRESITIFGTDYETDDGTCIRDYIHVEDLAGAHLNALTWLLKGGDSQVLNCGYGHGYSVREVIETVKAVSGVDFEVVEGSRRAGDPPELIADSSRIRERLGWTPNLDNLEIICRTAWKWEQKLSSQHAAGSG
ncbi:MAG: UDP-glucose 4-epimerase GalE [Arenicellales bacterium]|nr:UDP-glucose 4-epimerase GalE [Arenicellales bacterium]MDP7284092.1 UDP-glucose 4-epimerase GalE [Arenicellales bacterium]MDP7481329.1 UDP-glucose 4-epimerase GalE [Arenicellales bacterium]|tara:strand:+ start:422 stop:1438 length:1017 start_codon:yes stop_codon:yes gene_type:complete